MADSKHTKPNWRDWLHIVGIVGLIIGLCHIWLGDILWPPAEIKPITFEIITKSVESDSLSQVDYQKILDNNYNQIKSFKELLSTIKTENQNSYYKITKLESQGVSRLSAFYGTLFTAIAVIVAIVGLIGWRTIKDYKKDFEDHKIETGKTVEEARVKIEEYKEIKMDTEFIRKKRQHIDWIEKKFKGLSNKNIESMDLSSPEDQKNLTEITDYVTKDIYDCSWLELIYAYNLIYDLRKDSDALRQNLDQAEIILNFLKCRAIPDNPYLKAQFLHIYGQLYFQNYLLISKEFNLFNSTDDDLIKDDGEKIKCAEDYIEKSYEKYKSLIDNKRLSDNINRNETLGNIALNRIELYKIRKANKKPEIKLLDEAMSHLKEIGKIKFSFNQLWDYYRVLYYLNDKKNRFVEENFKKDLKRKPKKKKELQSFIQQIIKEQREFKDKGFPGDEKFIDYLLKELSIN